MLLDACTESHPCACVKGGQPPPDRRAQSEQKMHKECPNKGRRGPCHFAFIPAPALRMTSPRLREKTKLGLDFAFAKTPNPEASESCLHL